MKNPLDYIFIREPHICPWWCCFTFDNPIRRITVELAKAEGFKIVDEPVVTFSRSVLFSV
jgi:hypothetical protein